MWYGFDIDVVNVLDDPELEAQYGLSVPVAFVDGKLACKAHFDPGRFARLLEEAGAGRPRG
jgi:hypothetical protein